MVNSGQPSLDPITNDAQLTSLGPRVMQKMGKKPEERWNEMKEMAIDTLRAVRAQAPRC